MGTHVSDLCYSGHLNIAWPKALTVNHIVCRDYLGWPKAVGYKDTLIRQDMPRPLEVSLPGAGPLFGMCGVWTIQAC